MRLQRMEFVEKNVCVLALKTRGTIKLKKPRETFTWSPVTPKIIVL